MGIIDSQFKGPGFLQGSDRQRWGELASYKSHWGGRARLAAELIPSGVTVLEIGVGTGTFRDLVAGRTDFIGADLEPLDSRSVRLDLDLDSLPVNKVDYAVLLGVFTYLRHPHLAAAKICSIAGHLVVSYCCKNAAAPIDQSRNPRRQRGWLNDFTKAEFVGMISALGLSLVSETLLHADDEIEELLMVFQKHRLSDHSFAQVGQALRRA